METSARKLPGWITESRGSNGSGSGCTLHVTAGSGSSSPGPSDRRPGRRAPFRCQCDSCPAPADPRLVEQDPHGLETPFSYSEVDRRCIEISRVDRAGVARSSAEAWVCRRPSEWSAAIRPEIRRNLRRNLLDFLTGKPYKSCK